MKSSARLDEVKQVSVGGEPPGFSDCFRAFDDEFDYVCRILRRCGVGAGDAEDLAQDVLVVVWRRWADFDRGRPLRPWLMGIATRVAHDFLKRRWREIPLGHVDTTDPGLVGEDHIEAARARRLVLSTLAALPDRHRVAIILHELEGLPPHEIAQAMGVPMSTAYTRLRRARFAFARALARLKKSAEREKPAAAFARRLGSNHARIAGIAAGAAAAIALLVVGLSRPGHERAPTAAIARSTTPGLGGTHLQAGLVGYWPFDDARGSTVARDRSGKGNDCVLHDLDPDGAWTGRAVDLRRGGWLECPQPALPDGRRAPDMTVMARVRPEGIQERHSAVVTRETGDDHDDLFFFGFVGDHLKVSSRAWLGWVSRPVSVDPDCWVHVAFTRRAGGATRLYLNGAQVGENQQGERLIAGGGPTPLMVGGGHVGFDGTEVRQHFVGLIAELAIYDRALAPQEIAAAASAPLTL